MMTMREARQRAEVYGVRIATMNTTLGKLYGAAQGMWSVADKRIRWRSDVEDAVLDCRHVSRL